MTITAPSAAWTQPQIAAARHVSALAARVRLSRAVTPPEWDAELERLTRARRAGLVATPGHLYAPQHDGEQIGDELSRIADSVGRHDDVSACISDRAAELALEARIAASVGTDRVRLLARARYRSAPDDDARAERWSRAYQDTDEDAETTWSDDEQDPRSLVCSMRRAVGERRLAVRVVVHSGMAALAATGDGVIVVAARRRLRQRDIARTVVHEVDGHAVPAALRRALPAHAAFRPAGDSDLEEGRALLIEQKQGFFDGGRRKELALRHLAACLVHDGATFDDAADALEARGAHPTRAVAIVARASRGGGLGRERVYLPSFWRVTRRVAGL